MSLYFLFLFFLQYLSIQSKKYKFVFQKALCGVKNLKIVSKSTPVRQPNRDKQDITCTAHFCPEVSIITFLNKDKYEANLHF